MKLSPNFTLAEFKCKCGCGYEKRPEIQDNLKRLCVNVLEPLRLACGNRRMTITSGARCPAHNARVGGAPKSTHKSGKGADVVVDGLTPPQVQEIAKGVKGIGGIGCGDSFTHVDDRGRRVVFGY